MERTLLIEDLRDIKATRIARTYDDGIAALQEEVWDVLYLDHDFGDNDPHKTGYGVICWLEANTEHLPRKIVLVTSNPVGRKQMETVIAKLYP